MWQLQHNFIYIIVTQIILVFDGNSHEGDVTHCGLMTQYGDLDLVQHWLCEWLVA